MIQRQLDKLAATKAANEAAEMNQSVEPQKDTIQFDDFQKMDIRVSTILEAEKVAKTKKLLKLTVDTGIDQTGDRIGNRRTLHARRARRQTGPRIGEPRSARIEGYSFQRYDPDGRRCVGKIAFATTRRTDQQRGCRRIGEK